jgi:hypothetical protein
MSGVRFFVFMACVFGVASTFLPWAALGLVAGCDESGFRLGFGIVSMLGFLTMLVALYATRCVWSSTTIRALCLAASAAILLVDVVFALVAKSIWHAVAVNDYLSMAFETESAGPAIGWYASVASSSLTMGCALVPRLWRPSRY